MAVKNLVKETHSNNCLRSVRNAMYCALEDFTGMERKCTFMLICSRRTSPDLNWGSILRLLLLLSHLTFCQADTVHSLLKYFIFSPWGRYKRIHIYCLHPVQLKKFGSKPMDFSGLKNVNHKRSPFNLLLWLGYYQLTIIFINVIWKMLSTFRVNYLNYLFLKIKESMALWILKS